MRFWFDTEFIEDGKTIELVSIGVVSEDGRTYYAETDDYRPGKASQWVKDNVLAHLHGGEAIKSRDVIASDLVAFMGDDPEIWAYYADYDWVTICQLFGTMMQLPAGWPMFCRDVKQLAVSLGNPKLPEQTSQEHHALADAQWTREAWLFLQNDRPNWDKVMGAGGARSDDNHLVAVTKGTLRLAGSALREQNRRDYYHNYGAAEGEVLSALRRAQ